MQHPEIVTARDCYHEVSAYRFRAQLRLILAILTDPAPCLPSTLHEGA